MFHVQKFGRMPEDRARFYAAEVVCALKFLHKRAIIYRYEFLSLISSSTDTCLANEILI